MKVITHCVVYKLRTDGTPIVINCYSEEEQGKKLLEVFRDGYKDVRPMTPEQAAKVLDDFGKNFKPKPLTQKERWINWALGKK